MSTADQTVQLVEENTEDTMYSLSVTQFYDTLADLDVKCHRRNEKYLLYVHGHGSILVM